MSSQMKITVLAIAIGVTALITMTSKVTSSQELQVNDSQDGRSVNNKNMMMPGGNMTFGSSLDNAKMHLIEAIMDLNEGNIKGAIMQLNMTDEGIKMHEKEMMEMMKILKPNMSTTIFSDQNKTTK
ncbi:MAG TPA: hypothetical protein VFR61_00810 [Nitrososphaeraceae archaeon]|nr:hypothetical protein [Nitrososphaeraceae archaeon]